MFIYVIKKVLVVLIDNYKRFFGKTLKLSLYFRDMVKISFKTQ